MFGEFRAGSGPCSTLTNPPPPSGNDGKEELLFVVGVWRGRAVGGGRRGRAPTKRGPGDQIPSPLASAEKRRGFLKY